MRSKKHHPSLLHISNLSLPSHSAHITEVCEQSLFAFILSERWNDLSTNATYYKQFLTKKKSQIKPKYFTEFTTKRHKNCLHLSSLSPYPASQLDVFGHDGDSLGVDGTQISVFKQTHQVCFTGLLKRADSCTLKPQVGFEILGDLSHQPLERQLPDQQLSRLLVTTNLPQSHGPGPVAVWLLHPAGRGSALPGGLRGQLLAGGLPAGGLTSRLLGSGHFLSPKDKVVGPFSDRRAGVRTPRTTAVAAQQNTKLT